MIKIKQSIFILFIVCNIIENINEKIKYKLIFI